MTADRPPSEVAVGSGKFHDFAVGQLIERLAAHVKAHGVFAGPASNEVGVAIRLDQEEVVARSPVGAVPAASRQEGVIQRDGVAAASPMNEVRSSTHLQDIVPCATMRLITPDSIADEVGAIPAEDLVLPNTSTQPQIRRGPASHGVVAVTAEHMVAATPP